MRLPGALGRIDRTIDRNRMLEESAGVNMTRLLPHLSAAAIALAMPFSATAQGQSAPFDLTGPSLRITVARGGQTLPISAVPNLAAGDKLHVEAALPPDQSARLLMVVAFLRGATNPPPENWIFQAQTWKRKGKALDITVPDGARQAIVLLAPETGGGGDAVAGSVRGKPGTFVRASQDLTQASLDRSRLDTYLEAIRASNAADPKKLEQVSPVLARSLSIKLDASCLLRQPQSQAACLTQNHETLVLADSHSASIAETLTGAPTDLALQIAATPQGGYGYYSPYIGVVRDLAKLLGAFRTAQYQYIPAVTLYRGDALNLLLNAAPSFQKPQSVIVAALPPVEAPQLPPLKAGATDAAVCVSRPGFVLPVEGAPLVFSTGFAHDMALRLTGGSVPVELPVLADAAQGGYVAAPGALKPGDLPSPAEGTLHGSWGFQPFDGPKFRLENGNINNWRQSDDEPPALVVGRDNQVELRGGAPSCIESVTARIGSADPQPVAFERVGPGRIAVTLPLAKARPGDVTLQIVQSGAPAPATVALRSYAEASRIDTLILHAGDRTAELVGARLDQVSSVTVEGTSFRPGALSRAGDGDHLALEADAAPASLTAGQTRTARVALNDGRTVPLKTTVAPPRPSATMLSKTVSPAAARGVELTLTSPDALPQDARLTFSLRTGGAPFSAGTVVEVATADGSASAKLGMASGLALQDQQVAVATLEPGKALGPAAFGPLRFRVVQDATPGDWQPLGTLVRLPQVQGIQCRPADKRCTLSGSQLFLIESVASKGGADRVDVPQGFTDTTLQVPRPTARELVVKLRDGAEATVRVGGAG